MSGAKPDPMRASRRRDDETVPFKKSIAGNELFDRVVHDTEPSLAPILIDTLKLVGSAPEEMTHEQLGDLLPEIERRLRLVTDPEVVRNTLARTRKILLGWE